jgi:Uma2 family endonuclease
VKVPLYAEAGVEWLWLVDPDARRVEVLQTRSGTLELVDTLDGAVTRAIAPFASVMDTSEWWLEPPRR